MQHALNPLLEMSSNTKPRNGEFPNQRYVGNVSHLFMCVGAVVRVQTMVHGIGGPRWGAQAPCVAIVLEKHFCNVASHVDLGLVQMTSVATLPLLLL